MEQQFRHIIINCRSVMPSQYFNVLLKNILYFFRKLSALQKNWKAGTEFPAPSSAYV